MRNKTISTLLTLTIFLGGFTASSIADEIVLCISQANQYVAMVNNKGDCIDDENQVVISGSDMASKKSMTPVANFLENKNCDGEGTLTEIGFDSNENGQLDKDEITSTAGTCSPTVVPEEETESSEVANSSE